MSAKHEHTWVRSTHPQQRAKGASEEASRALPAKRREFEGSALIEKGDL